MFNSNTNALVARNDIFNAVFSANGMGSLNQEAKARIINGSSATVLADKKAKSNAKVTFINNDIVIDFFFNNAIVDTMVIDGMDKCEAIRFAQIKLLAIASQRTQKH